MQVRSSAMDAYAAYVNSFLRDYRAELIFGKKDARACHVCVVDRKIENCCGSCRAVEGTPEEYGTVATVPTLTRGHRHMSCEK